MSRIYTGIVNDRIQFNKSILFSLPTTKKILDTDPLGHFQH